MWLGLAASVTAIWVATIASEWRALTTVCRISSRCDIQIFNRLDASQVHTLSEHGISIYAFAMYNIAVTAAFLVIWYGFGALVIWRKPGDRGALVAAFFLVVFPTLLDPRYPFRMDRIEPLIEALVLHEAGGRVLLEKRIVHGDDHAADIARLERAAERRRELLADDPDDEDVKASLDKTEAQIAGLRSQPHEPDSFEWREAESGIKVADHWAALDTAGRAKFLRDWEVTCFADRQGAETRLGWLELYSDAFRLSSGDSRLCPAALPALITHSQEWQRVPGPCFLRG